jgi:hypothetical protein
MKMGYLEFQKFKPNGRKTFVVFITSKRSGTKLGLIKWYPSWRQYCFFPIVMSDEVLE